MGVLLCGAQHGRAQMTAANVAAQQKACDGGKQAACFNMGLVYMDGLGGTTKDLAKAAALFRKGCDAKYGSACQTLGLMYETGTGLEKDVVKAVQAYEQGCDAGSASSCTQAAAFYESGDGGVTKDAAKGATLRAQACKIKPDGDGCK
jgi:TPR repeat protein